MAAWQRKTKAPTPGSYWASPEYARLRDTVDEKHGVGFMDREEVGLWEIGYDWVEPYNSCKYSTGIVTLQCASLNEEDRHKAFNCKVVALIPGPQIPGNLEPYLQRTLNVFKECGWEAKASAKLPNHMPFLSGVAADTPARCKWSHEMGVGAYRGCGTCLFTGTRSGNCMCYKGFLDPALQVDRTYKHVGDPSLSFTDAEGEELAKQGQGKETGFKALSSVHSTLPYTSFKHLWLTPLCHALLHGLVGDFLEYAFITLPSQAKARGTLGGAIGVGVGPSNPVQSINAAELHNCIKLVKDAKNTITVASEFKRKYKCVFTYRYVMVAFHLNGCMSNEDVMMHFNSFNAQHGGGPMKLSNLFASQEINDNGG